MNPSRIHVYCRLRRIEDRNVGAIQSYTNNDQEENYCTISVQDRSTLFAVDKLFDQHSQQEIFQNSLEPLIEDIFSGINCTLFTYGQTGSGKTHTVIGGQDPEQCGLLPRSIDFIFQRIQTMENDIENIDEKPEFIVKVSILEIYHEKLRDLLSGGKQEQNLAIRENADGTIWVEHLSDQKIQSPSDYSKLLQQALKRRVVGSHKMNDQSSRSHLCCLISLTYKDKQKQRQLHSKLSLIDLAGSEMAKKTDASGQRFDEAKFINKSLSALSKVIHALSTQQHCENNLNLALSASIKAGASLVHPPSHIPYRDSKLTRLLQHSLSGNAKTVIFLTISDDNKHVSETISTLKFGERARLVVTKPRINIDSSITTGQSAAHVQEKMIGYQNEILDYQNIIKQLQNQVTSMQSIIQDLQSENLSLLADKNAKSSIASVPSMCSTCQQCTAASTDQSILEPSADRKNAKSVVKEDKISKDKVNNDDEQKTFEEEVAEQHSDNLNEEENEDDIDEEEEEDEYSDRCGICGLNQQQSDHLCDTTGENLGFFFHCDGNCGSMFHVRCVGLVGDAGQYILPEGEWFCLSCQEDLENPSLSATVENHEQMKSEIANSDDNLEEKNSKIHEETSALQISPSKAALASVNQQEVHMARIWQQQYDMIRKDRNRILLQWQNDKELFQVNQQQRQVQQEQRETVILQLEDDKCSLEQALSQQQHETNTLRSNVQELQMLLAESHQKLQAAAVSSTFNPVSSSVDNFDSKQVRNSSSVLASKEDENHESPQTSSSSQSPTIKFNEKKTHREKQSRSRRYEQYDAAYSIEGDDDGESEAVEGTEFAPLDQNDPLEESENSNDQTGFESLLMSANRQRFQQHKSASPKQKSQLPPTHGQGKSSQNAQTKSVLRNSTTKLLLSSTMPNQQQSGKSAKSKVSANESHGISGKTVTVTPATMSSPSLLPKTSANNDPLFQSLARSSSDRDAGSLHYDSGDLGGGSGSIGSASPVGGVSASRFVNPLRNRLSELIAQAEEEKESFAELRMKLQSRSDVRASGSRELLRNSS